MVTHLRKVRRQRGSRTHGWGTSGQHRKGGMRGGYGKSGWRKHKWTHTVKYEKDRIGKHGFICPTSKGSSKILNVGNLEHIIAKSNSKEKLESGEGFQLNLQKLGYNKLLGGGVVTQPFKITIEACSKIAQKKVEEAGGNIELIRDKENK